MICASLYSRLMLTKCTLALAIALALAGCPIDDESCDIATVDEQNARDRVTALCDEQMMLCTFKQDIRLAWKSGHETSISPVRCAENVQLCLFATWHEFGHVLAGDDEAVADCYAASHATEAQIDAAICYFEGTVHVADEAHGSGPERVNRIEACR